MSLDHFLYRLHFDMENSRPHDLEVNWEDAPLTYKLYRGLPVFPLPDEIPLSLFDQKVGQEPSLNALGTWLWYSYGLSQISQSLITRSSRLAENEKLLSFVTNRRPVPSGGALYPSELYVYVKLPEMQHGVYHYDSAHHRLVQLREGNYDGFLTNALGGGCSVKDCFAVAFVSIYFWKNFFKYDEFSYRLQGLDAGVLIGQLQEMASQLGISSAVYYQFLDRSVNLLLGLLTEAESTYAIVPLTLHSDGIWQPSVQGDVTADELIQELPEQKHVQVIRSKRMREFPALLQMNDAVMLESTDSFSRYVSQMGAMSNTVTPNPIILPRSEHIDYDLAQFCRERFSPEMDFVRKKTDFIQVARILDYTMSVLAYSNDLDVAERGAFERLSMYVSISQVDGLCDGAYRYDHDEHALYPIAYGDWRARLQDGMALDNVNLYQVPLCFHVAGRRDHLISQLQYRGYRIQQMEAGIVVHRLLLAAFTCGMGGHPLLGFDVQNCDDLYKLDTEEKTTLIQIPVGHYRPRARFQGGLHG